MSELDGVELCCRFSLVPNKLGYCGPESAKEVLLNYINSKKNVQTAKEQLKRFEGLYPYLELIAEKNNREPFDYKVIEAYWLGNSFLENVTEKDLKKLILKKFSSYLTKSIAEKLSATVPDGVNVHHSFHVLHILKIASLKGRVPINFNTQRSCIISWGRIISDNTIDIRQLDFKEKYFISEVRREINYRPDSFKKNDYLTIHWNNAVIKLSKKQVKNLKKYTNENINAINSSMR